jgi:hypothetical protein
MRFRARLSVESAQFCMIVTQMTIHSRMYNEEFHTAVQRTYEVSLLLMFSDITFKVHLFIHQRVAFVVR